MKIKISLLLWGTLPVPLLAAEFKFINLITVRIKYLIIYHLIFHSSLLYLPTIFDNHLTTKTTAQLRSRLQLPSTFISLPVAHQPYSHYRPHLNFRLSTGVSIEACCSNLLFFVFLLVYVSLLLSHQMLAVNNAYSSVGRIAGYFTRLFFSRSVYLTSRLSAKFLPSVID